MSDQESPDPETALAAGIALYADGEYHAAHDPWEAVWLDLDAETAPEDERLFHGLVQVTAAVYHARDGNFEGATGLAESASDYLEPLSPNHRGVESTGIREFCDRLVTDPELIERAEPPEIRLHGRPVSYLDLSIPAMTLAAEAIAEEYGYDESVVTSAGAFAETDAEDAVETPALASGEAGSPAPNANDSRFATFLLDFLTQPENRGIIFQRLREHVERRRQANADVTGLFDVE
ncbi:MAG: DUF309 domain-containing protein [Halobaculum sp.]